ncbi:homeobox protein Hox-A4-like [Dendroctonus ponderosae]|uniref:homeobox protein Hox-A4-like n=1 Tax=Dendroctonus ponderosae TaxID=77166 RepID=UPI0020364803|nr:homeobox protein Hox-A4-like [Dendroctonus ponderosae]XP_048526487.1 homeobox protein Hox-A4-like [Dendroctonus ponderosae]XP_048526489.1 homeobox protein Hox-A4-like [Dendroctonus ponderosae]XP_048526494.1 homeobox protein Hox-A4-like [Dendroctonus ponderosae]
MSEFSCSLNDSPIDNTFPVIQENYQEQYFAVQQPYSFANEQVPMASQDNFRITMGNYEIAQNRLPGVNQMIVCPPYPPSQNYQPQYADLSAVFARSSHMINPTLNDVKRVRTQYRAHQIIQLENTFNNSKYLSRTQRINLSEQLNMTEKQIKVWFQNRRMKHKKRTRLDRPVSSSDCSYTINSSPASNPVQGPRQIQMYEHLPPFTFGSNTIEPNSTCPQPIPNQLNNNLSASEEELLNLSDMKLYEFDFDEVANVLNALG